MPRKRVNPETPLPQVRCDFNSVGWSGEEGDECYYSFDEAALARCRPRPGMRVFIFEPSRGELVMGCQAVLERYEDAVTHKQRWRLRPVPDTGYLGELP